MHKGEGSEWIIALHTKNPSNDEYSIQKQLKKKKLSTNLLMFQLSNINGALVILLLSGGLVLSFGAEPLLEKLQQVSVFANNYGEPEI